VGAFSSFGLCFTEEEVVYEFSFIYATGATDDFYGFSLSLHILQQKILAKA
jgi:hypothetical protein